MYSKTKLAQKSNVLYQPSFSWKDNKIFDGDRQIASFIADSYMGPILHDMFLKPGGKPLINWAIGWRAQFVTSTYIVDKISAKGEGSAKLEMEFVSHTPDKCYTSQTYIVLTYEENLKSYVYNAKSTLLMNKFPFANWSDFCQKCTQWYLTVPLEFTNINPLNKTMWQVWIYKDVEGNWIKIPLTHLWSPGFYDIQFNRKQGILGLFDSPDGNPVIELLDNTSENSKGALCFSAHDMHLKCKLNMYSQKYWAKYRLFSYDDKHSKNIVNQARCQVYSSEELEVYGLPRFESEKINDFTQEIDITTNDRGAFWIPFGDIGYSKWLKTGGYKGKGCVKTKSETPVSINWLIIDFFVPGIISGKDYMFSAYVKTENLEGEGAYLFCKIGEEEYTSSKLTGNNDWTKVQITISAPSEVRHTKQLALHHKGKGCSLFSHVEFRELK